MDAVTDVTDDTPTGILNDRVLNRKVSIQNQVYRVTTFQAPKHCICCGQELPVRDALHMEWRTLTALRKGVMVSLTRQQFIILKFLAETTEPLPTDRLISFMYADDPDGGADSKSINVITCKLNMQIRKIGLAVRATNRGPGAMRYLDYRPELPTGGPWKRGRPKSRKSRASRKNVT